MWKKRPQESIGSIGKAKPLWKKTKKFKNNDPSQKKIPSPSDGGGDNGGEDEKSDSASKDFNPNSIESLKSVFYIHHAYIYINKVLMRFKSYFVYVFIIFHYR